MSKVTNEQLARLAELEKALSAGDIERATSLVAQVKEAIPTRTAKAEAWAAEQVKLCEPILAQKMTLPKADVPYTLAVNGDGTLGRIVVGQDAYDRVLKAGPSRGGNGTGERNPVTIGDYVTGALVTVEPIDAEGAAFLAEHPDAKPETPQRLGTVMSKLGSVGKTGHTVGSVSHYKFAKTKHLKINVSK
jgi:hypothetical protein